MLQRLQVKVSRTLYTICLRKPYCIRFVQLFNRMARTENNDSAHVCVFWTQAGRCDNSQQQTLLQQQFTITQFPQQTKHHVQATCLVVHPL